MSIFKNTFTKSVQDQLTIRQNGLQLRSSQVVNVINSRNSWIRWTSSVNVNGSNDLAKKYILQGGILSSKQQQRFGVGGQDAAYSNISPSGEIYRLGIRPMPGITGADVTSKSAYGSLREVKIDFQCWDIKQLEDLEILYMRPGYTALIEWGWSPYIDNKGKTQSNIPYYDILDTTKSKEQIWKDIFQKSQDLSGNYDAMFGYVKNFGWSARPDGGYDCHTTLISIGEVIESLKINYAPFSSKMDILNKGVTGLLDDADLSDYYSKNILAGLFYEFFQLASSKGTYSGDGQLYNFKDANKVVYNFFVKKLGLNHDVVQDDKKISGSHDQVYIRLGSLIDMLNNYVLLSDSKNKTPLLKLSTKERTYDSTNTLVDKSLLCLAYPLQVSVDPSICLIKNNFWINAKFNISPVNESTAIGANNIVKFSNKDYSKLIQYLFDEILGSNPENINKEQITDQITKIVGTNYNDTKEFSRQFWQYRKSYHISTFLEVKAKYGYSDSIIKTKYNLQKLGTSVSSNYKSDEPVSNLFLDHDIYSSNDLKTKILPGSQKIPQSEYTYTSTTTGNSITGVSTFNDPIFNDPIFGIDPTEYENAKIKEKTKPITDSAKSSENLKFLKQLEPYFLGDNNKVELGIIENYYINLQYLYSLSLDPSLTGLDKKEKNDLHLYDFVKTVLQSMQNCTGNINNFDIHVDPIDNVARIIDVNYVDETKRIDAYNNAFIVELQGLRSSARNYSLQSQIFPEQSTIVAISAQNGGGQLGMDNNTMIAFQRNITDRIIPIKDAPTVDNSIQNDSSQKIDILNKSLSKLYQYFGDLGSGFFSGSSFDVSKSSDYKNALKDIIAFFKGLTKSDSKNRNIIPTKLTIELDGIGGLVIGHLFRIPLELLPKGYKGDDVGSRIGYIVTGINHKIGNDWITSIESQIIILDEPVGELNIFDILFTDPTTGQTTVNLTVNTKGTVIVNKPSIQDYQTKFTNTIVNPGKVSEVDKIVDKIVASKTRYQNISTISGGNTPWYIIGVIHYNECNLSFSHHLHNGDPLTARTVRVPSGRIPTINPPYKFEDSAVDALKFTGFTTKNLSDISHQLLALEEYNGMGYSQRGVNSPYIWSFTNQYTSGKFIADHQYSSTAVSDQTGAAAILKRMQDRKLI